MTAMHGASIERHLHKAKGANDGWLDCILILSAVTSKLVAVEL